MALRRGIVDELMKIVGEENCSTRTSELYVYAFDGGIHRRIPDAVVRPSDTGQVKRIVELANRCEVPLIPRGAGTGLCGQVVPIKGGIVVDMQGMNELKEIRVDGLYCVVEPGMVCDDFNAALKPHGFFIPGPASSEVATLGGMVGTNSSGAKALKYGATRDYVLGLTVVLPTGDVVEMGSRTPKNSGGFQFEKFFVGMEGTLGIITEIIIKVAPLPRARAACVAYFDDLERTGRCVSNIIAHRLIPSQIEIMSETSIKAVNKATGMGLLECAGILLIEMDGHPSVVSEEVELVGKVCEESGAIKVEFTDDEKRIDELWKGRKQMIPSLSILQKEYATVMLADDMAVPIYNVPKALAAFEEISNEYDIHIPAYGHAGDGNLHTKVLMDPTNPDHWRQAEEAVARIYDVVLSLGGTTTGEHGIGITKAPFLHKERKTVIKAMKAIKGALDPKDIMNPMKMMDWEEGFVTHLRYPLQEVRGEGDLSPWLNEMITCTQCGYCKAVCPGFKSLGWDSGAPRGKVVLSYGMLTGEIEKDESIAERLFQCVLCGDCYRRCPSDVRAPEIIKAARAELVDAGFAYKTHVALVENILRTGNIYGDEDVKIPDLEGEVSAFIGCQYGSRMNRTKRYIRILERLDVKVRPEGGLCCGYPMAVLGFRRALEDYRKRFLERFQKKEMIAFCPSCVLFLKEEYGFPARHVVQAMLDRLKGMEVKRVDGAAVTYHDPCDLARGLGVVEEPREILKLLGYELREMEHNRNQSLCCGGGGGILTSDVHMSADIARSRIEEALRTGAETLVTACPTCEQVLRKAAQGVKKGKGIQVRELSDLVWGAIK